jgi:hypothetical protein
VPKILPFSSIRPAAFRHLHALREQPLGALDKPSVAATWRASTFSLHVWSIGYFVGWLQWSKRFKDAAELQDYVIPEVIGGVFRRHAKSRSLQPEAAYDSGTCWEPGQRPGLYAYDGAPCSSRTARRWSRRPGKAA